MPALHSLFFCILFFLCAPWTLSILLFSPLLSRPFSLSLSLSFSRAHHILSLFAPSSLPSIQKKNWLPFSLWIDETFLSLSLSPAYFLATSRRASSICGGSTLLYGFINSKVLTASRPHFRYFTPSPARPAFFGPHYLFVFFPRVYKLKTK